MSKVKIYVITSKKGVVVYIGKTKVSLKKRFDQHKQRCPNPGLCLWLKNNTDAKIVLLELVNCEVGSEKEKEWIKKYKSKNLFNRIYNRGKIRIDKIFQPLPPGEYRRLKELTKRMCYKREK